jgi:hypothetical protein
MQTFIQYGIIAIVLIIISLVIVKLSKKNFNIEANKLILLMLNVICQDLK